jgi:aspartyl-tRNA(Asn)/glutamyl-tRNA(Gln) amidotransferase subunit A
MTDTDLAFASIAEVASLLRKRKLSPVELTKLILTRIEKLNPRLNAFLTVSAELALSQAKKAEAELFAPRSRKAHLDRGPLHGIPISLKDNIYTQGIRTTAGSKILKDFIPVDDAQVVAQVKNAGAVILGKTNLHEFAYGVTSNNPHFGPVHNPWDLSRIPGGSSGGTAAAVASGISYASIGTDTGGSIRIPAALCGVVGLKPGLARVSTQHVVPLSSHLDFVGPLARSASDTAIVLDAIFLRAKKEKKLYPLRTSTRRSARFRLGVPSDFFFDVVSQEVSYAFDVALRNLGKQGALLKRVAIPFAQESEDAGNQIAWAETTYAHQQAGWFPAKSPMYGEDVRSRLQLGSKVSATDYLHALDARESFIRRYHQTLADAGVDALVFPTTPIAAPLIGEETVAVSGTSHTVRALLLRMNRPANLAGVPAVSVPCGFTPQGLPVGLQFISAITDERLLLELAATLERAQPSSRRPPLASG